jgi:hypothetical protein
MTKWWNYSDKIEAELINWFKDEDLGSWLTFSYEIFVGSSTVKNLVFTVKDGECTWTIVYSDGWCYQAGSHVCKSVYDILIGLETIMSNPEQYRV